MGSSALIRELDGKYRILAELGQGGTANVWLAVARGPSGFNKLVVLKSMKAELLSEPELARMFMNEARLAARLNHPNIVQTNEVFEFKGLPVIVMEYLEGQPFSAVLTRCRGTDQFPAAMQLRVVSEALGGLHAAHELTDFDGTPLKVVHRDISPHNIFITFAGQVKVLDFGIAKLSGAGEVTETGVIKGKLHYMPPEQITAEGVDRRADIYAMGVVLWEVATGRRMWKGMNDAVVMNSILNGEIPPPSEVRDGVDEELERIIMKSLAVEKEDRYQTATDFQTDLDEYIASMSHTVRNRDMGATLEHVFSDVRDERQKVIEAQLAKVSSLSDDEFADFAPIELTTYSATGAGTVRDSAPDKKRKSKTALLVALVALMGAVVGAIFFGQTNAPARSVELDTPTAPSEPVTKSEVKVRITAFPGQAKLYLDDELLPSNPFTKTYKLDEETAHALRAEAKGYETEKRELKFDDDLEIILTLVKEEQPEEEANEEADDEPTPAPRPVWRPRPKPQPKPQTQNNCDPPFYFDDRGVKKYKPECF